jgi:hypothetical protein
MNNISEGLFVSPGLDEGTELGEISGFRGVVCFFEFFKFHRVK